MSKAEQAVLERRLRPIYDAIDLENNRKAIQEADKILKKHPNLVCAKVLKALAFIRSERLAEGFALIDTYDVPGAHHDDLTLQAFVHCFKEAALPLRICRLYERAVEVSPTEQNMTQLFMSYVRMKNYKNQQQIAMKLYKDFSNGPYLCWAVMSIVMQAYKAETDLSRKMFFPLAEKMLSSYILKNGYQTSANVELYLLILEGLQRYAEAEKLLTSDSIKQFMSSPPNFVLNRRLRFLLLDKHYSLVIERTVEALKENNDDWTLWTLLFDAAFEILLSDESKKKQALDDVVHAVTSHCSLGGKNRGPYLARLELLTRLVQIEDTVRSNLGTKLGEPFDLIMAYFRRFYTKPCCFTDIEKYLCLLNDCQKSDFFSQVEKFVNELDDSNTENITRAFILVERLRFKLGLLDDLNRSEKRKVCQNIFISLNKYSDQENSAADLAQLAAAILWNEWRFNDDWQAYYELVLLLELIASRYQSDPYCKLVLCRAYAHIGNLNRVIALTTALDIKSVQKDTLGHFLFPMYNLSGRYNHAIIHYTELTNMYSQAEREINECLVAGYKNGTFAQIKGLVELDERMQNSSLACGGDVTNRYLSGLFVLQNINEIVHTFQGDEDPIVWNTVCDNRDLTVVPSYEPDLIKLEIIKAKEDSHQEFVNLTKLRHYLCQAVASLGNESNDANAFKADLDKLKNHIEMCKTMYGSTIEPVRIIQSAAPVRLDLWVNSASLDMIVQVLDVAFDIMKAKEAGKSPVAALSITGDELLNKFKTATPPPFVPTSHFSVHDMIYQLSFIMQAVSLIQVIIALMGKRGNTEERNAFSECCADLFNGSKSYCRYFNAKYFEYKKALHDEKSMLFPTVGDDWSAEISGFLKTQEDMVKDRCLKSYELAVEDMAFFSGRLLERKWL